DLMRLFGSDRIARMMDRMGIEEGEVIQHSLITKSIERAQKKVEENNFGIRKRLIDYDDVMNQQREVIYTRRRHALFGERLSLDISNMFLDVCETIASEYHTPDILDYDGFKIELLRVLSMECPISQADFESMKTEEIAYAVFDKVQAWYQKKHDKIAQEVFPFIKSVHEDKSNNFQIVQIPISDGIRVMPVVVNLEEAFETQGKAVMRELEKTVILAVMDDEWKEHLREMDDLRQSVQNAVYEQKDPLLIYKFESFELFKTMLIKVNKSITTFLLKSAIFVNNPNQIQEAQVLEPAEVEYETSRPNNEAATAQQGGEAPAPKPQQPAKAEKRVGRNDPCPCGSGKKYKNCHGK
ncbi:MAG TPA: SEC-C metal-binding domain-containing protein, partial [Bacteroidia bacterium]|nr:SEC-C metal-binding domain-containing protein [Bacteroidia bacterium]